jgi:uncharacterized membrane protein
MLDGLTAGNDTNNQAILEAQNQSKQAYQNYVNLLTQDCSDEIKINNALEKFRQADEKLRKLQNTFLR